MLESPDKSISCSNSKRPKVIDEEGVEDEDDKQALSRRKDKTLRPDIMFPTAFRRRLDTFLQRFHFIDYIQGND